MDNGAIPNEYILNYCGYKGYLEHLKYMIEAYKINYKNLYITTGYSNNETTKIYIDSLV